MKRRSERIRLKPHFRVEVVPPDTVYLLSEYRHTVLRGRLYCELVPLLDGSRTEQEIVRDLRGVAVLPAIRAALVRLDRRGLLVFGEPSRTPEAEAFWTLLGADPEAADARLRSSTVSVHSLTNTFPEPLSARLEDLGVAVMRGDTANGEGPDLSVVVVDDYLEPELEALNRFYLGRGTAWLLLKPAGAVPWVGPIFVPSETGCWSCLASRLRANRVVESTIKRQLGAATTGFHSLAGLPSTSGAALDIAATEIAKWLVLRSADPGSAAAPASDTIEGEQLTSLVGMVAVLDLATLQLDGHVLTQRPQCGVCGDPDLGWWDGEPVRLISRSKVFTADGGHRICTPEETVARLTCHVSPITGAVKALERLPVRPEGLVHYYVSTYPFYRAEDADELHDVLIHHGGGKGMTDVQARASVLCESIERYCAVFPDDGAVSKVAAVDDIRDDAVNPADLLLYSENQYRTRDEFNPRYPRRYLVPERFDEARPIRWTRAWSLTDARYRLLPTAFAYFGSPVDDDHMFCYADSNGNAAGNCLEEAILQGLLEVVERDSTAVWWYNRLPRPGVDLGSFDEPYLPQLVRWYEAKNRELWVLDLTSDLGIPTFGALSRRIDGPPASVTMGFGSHLDARIGVLRAVTELNQGNVLCRAFEASPAIDSDDSLQHIWMKEATLEDHPYLAPAVDEPARVAEDYPEMAGDDLRTDVETCVESLRQNDLEVLVLDQTRPDLELNAVKVVVPGLVHVWHRLAPGRLFEVPVRMGWTMAEPHEDDLNPIPFPI